MNTRKNNPALHQLKELERAGNRLGHETRMRRRHVSPVRIVNNTENFHKKATHFGAPGTITVFVGRTHKAIDHVHEAVEKGGVEVYEIARRILNTHPRHAEELGDALDHIAQSPTIVSITYGGVPLVEHVTIPDGQDLVALTLPYNGGRLAPQGLELQQFVQGREEATHAGLALVTMPSLTAAEIAALEALPDWGSILNVGQGADCGWACGVAAFSGAVAGGVLGATVGAAAGPGGAVAGGVVGAGAGAAAGYAVYNAFADALSNVGNADANANANAGAADAGAGDATANDAGAVQAGNAGGIISEYGLSLSDTQVAQLGATGTAQALLEMRRVLLVGDLQAGAM